MLCDNWLVHSILLSFLLSILSLLKYCLKHYTIHFESCQRFFRKSIQILLSSFSSIIYQIPNLFLYTMETIASFSITLSLLLLLNVLLWSLLFLLLSSVSLGGQILSLRLWVLKRRNFHRPQPDQQILGSNQYNLVYLLF